MKKLILTGVFLLLLSLSITGCGQTSYLELTEDSQTEDTETEDSDSGDEAEITDETTIYVHVCGAVAHPGVYELDAGARVFEAIEAAGGLRDDAAGDSINQADLLDDGQQLLVPTITEVAESAAAEAETADGLININTASETELMTLPGIGQSKAAAIVSYRENNGPFSSIEDIKNISGIKDGVYQKIVGLIKVN